MKQFKLPVKEEWETMTIAALERTLDEFNNWYSLNEERMTFKQADAELKRIDEFEAYVKTRIEPDPWRRVLKDRITELETKKYWHDKLIRNTIDDFRKWMAEEPSDIDIVNVIEYKTRTILDQLNVYASVNERLVIAKSDLAQYDSVTGKGESKMTNNMKPDTFELVTVFTDNEAIGNDPREYIDRNSVEDEIALTKEWWADKDIAYFEIDYYIDGERIKTEKIY